MALDVCRAQARVEHASAPLLDRTPATAAGLPPLRFAWSDVSVRLALAARHDGEHLVVRTADPRLAPLFGKGTTAAVHLHLAPTATEPADQEE